MSEAQRKATETYRRRMAARGLARFEVLGRPEDKALLRAAAQRLAAGDEALRSVLASEGEAPRGGILAALRRSPLVGMDLDFSRDKVPPRDDGL